MRRPALVAIWIVATIATTAVAYVAVNTAGAEVTDRPLTAVIAAGTGAGTDGTSAAPTSTATTAPTSAPSSTGPGTGTTGVAGSTPITTGSASTGATTTSSANPGTTSPSTTSSTASTTPTTASTATTGTTASEVPWQQTTVPSKGGLVIVSYRPDEVRLESVAPAAGFTYQIDEQGPSEVRVEFEGGDVRIEIRVRWDDELVTEINENN